MKMIDKYVERLKGSPFWKSVLTLVSGHVLAQMIGLMTTPVVSRLYNTTEYGEYAIVVSTASIIVSLMTLGLTSAIMAPKEDDECDRVFMVTFLTSSFLATLILIVMVSLSSMVHFFQPGMNYLVACFLVYILVLTSNLNSMLQVYVNRLKLNRVMFYNALIGSMATLCVTIPLGFLRVGSYGLLMGSIAANIVCIFQMSYHANPFRRLPKKNDFRNIFKKYRNYVLFQYPSNCVDGLADQLPTQMLSSYLGNANLGSYSMCEKILGIPARFVGTPINTIYFRTASEYHRQGINLSDFTFSLVSKILLLSFLPLAAFIFLSEPLFAFVLGSEWRVAGTMASFLILRYVLMFCSLSVGYSRVVMGKQKVNLAVSLLHLLIFAGSIGGGFLLFGDLLHTVICFTIGSSIYYVVDTSINFYCMKKNFFKYLLLVVGYFAAVILVWIAKDAIF